MPDELVHYGVADGIATVTLDSPHNRNALSRQLVGELFEDRDRQVARLEEVRASRAYRVAVGARRLLRGRR